MNTKQIKLIEAVACILNNEQIDGEGTQYLLQLLNMETQIHRQLNGKFYSQVIVDFLEEYADADVTFDKKNNETEIRNLKHRLACVTECASALRKFISKYGLSKVFQLPIDNECNGGFLQINNIEIASDLNDDESLRWNTTKK